MKTYSAQTGYVWEYYFVNHTAQGYRFDVSATRNNYIPVFVQIDRNELSQAASRELSAVEEYAVAKLSLLKAFDERKPSEIDRPVQPSRDDFAEILATLDLL